MTPAQISGWKNHLLGAVLIFIGLCAFYRGNVDAGAKAVLAGCALITLRDALGKLLKAVDANCETLNDLRAAIETELSTRRAGL
jgi:hypothetical protein